VPEPAKGPVQVTPRPIALDTADRSSSKAPARRALCLINHHSIAAKDEIITSRQKFYANRNSRDNKLGRVKKRPAARTQASALLPAPIGLAHHSYI